MNGGSAPWLQRQRGKWVANSRGCSRNGGRCIDAYAKSLYASTPLFDYGFGLTYTTFAYSNGSAVPSTAAAPAVSARAHGTADGGRTDPKALRLATPRFQKDEVAVWNVSVTITNTGLYAASEVVQVYIQDPAGLPFVPYWRRLVGFGKVRVQPGQSEHVTIPLQWTDVAMFDADMVLRLMEGEYTLYVGGSSEDTPIQIAATI